MMVGRMVGAAMRIGVFGGTFDPVHLGHLIMAEQCRVRAPLDEVWFVPAARPPHKVETELTRFDLRLEMLQLAVAGNPAFRILDIEKARPGPSFTADTLAELSKQRPGDELWLLVGSDTLADIPNWHLPEKVLELAGLLVVPRHGFAILDAGQLSSRLQIPAVRLQVIPAPQIEIASRDIRQRVAANESIRYLVPRAVECYVHDKKLYRLE